MTEVRIDGRTYLCYDIHTLVAEAGVALARIPYAGRVLIESLLRNGERASALAVARRMAKPDAADRAAVEIAFMPARLIMPDYTGIPALVDLAALRDRVADMGGSADSVNPVVPTDVVVDHSLLVEHAGSADALAKNEAIELDRNRERYGFLRWAQAHFDQLRVVPPGQGIVHQVNLERLADVVALREDAHAMLLYPDSVIGTDSHTTMINGLGVLGWGVGGLEAEAIMLGMPIRTALPECVGVHLVGALRVGVSATDLALTLTARLREEGVVGALVEFIGLGAVSLRAADRCTVANMAPEYGAMAAFFPIDAEVTRYLAQTGRDGGLISRVEAYCRAQGFWRDGDHDAAPAYDRMLTFDLGAVRPTVAGPSQPHQRLDLCGLRASLGQGEGVAAPRADRHTLQDGSVVLAAMTSCTNTSNPSAMLAAGLLARRAVERGLQVPAFVKTSLSPGSRAVTRYLEAAGLLPALETLGFHVVGYGCATCNGGGGPLLPGVAETIERQGLRAAAVLSGNRNFEGRVHRMVRCNYL
ncbi:MAG: aconitate hydratase AcnA, partial [Lysobacteraceae bacterium]